MRVVKLIQGDEYSDFPLYSKCLTVARGDFSHARALAEGKGNERVAELLRVPNIGAQLKATIAAGSTAGLSAPLSHYQQIVNSFLQWSRCALDAMMPYTLGIRPGFSRLAIWTIGMTGSKATESRPKAMSSISLDADESQNAKAVLIAVFNEDVLRMEMPQGLFATELRNNLAAETDAVLLSKIVDTSTPAISASGSDAAAFLADLNAAIASVSVTARSRLFLIVDSQTAASLALMPDGAGGLAFPDMGVSGGSISGVEVIASGGILRDTSGASLVLIDAAQLAANGGSIIIDASGQAALEMESVTTSPLTASTVINPLWQLNQRAMKAERWFAVARLRNTAVSTIRDASYGAA